MSRRMGGVTLPSYRGDNINGIEFTAEARMPDPQRLLQAYAQSAATLNLLRAFAQGGYADLHNVHRWMLGFVAQLAGRRTLPRSRTAHLRNAGLHGGVRHHLGRPCRSCAAPISITSHEALLLPYEQAMTRVDSTSRRLVRHLGPHAVDRRPHPPARRRPCRIHARHQESDRPEVRPVAGARRSAAPDRRAQSAATCPAA